MAKRFIDSTLFKKSFIRSLESKHKLFWIYLFCDCNNAGIWEVDYEVAQIYLGTKISAKEINEIFAEKLIFFDNNKKAFIKDFITFQYLELSPTNMAHKNVIKELEKHGLYDSENKTFKGLERGFEAPIQGAKDKAMVMVLDEVKEKAEKKSKKHSFENSKYFNFELFISEIGADYQIYDLNYYYNKLKNGSDSKGYKYLNWLATCRDWINSDIKENKAVFKKAENKTKIDRPAYWVPTFGTKEYYEFNNIKPPQ